MFWSIFDSKCVGREDIVGFCQLAFELRSLCLGVTSTPEIFIIGGKQLDVPAAQPLFVRVHSLGSPWCASASLRQRSNTFSAKSRSDSDASSARTWRRVMSAKRYCWRRARSI